MADLHPERFLADVLDQPRLLAEPVAALDAVEPLARRARRVLFLGMGSSRFAALDAAALLRSHGLDAYAELASTGRPQPPAADTLVRRDLGVGRVRRDGHGDAPPPRHEHGRRCHEPSAVGDRSGGRCVPGDRGRRAERRRLRELPLHRGAAAARVRPPARRRSLARGGGGGLGGGHGGPRGCGCRARSSCWGRPDPRARPGGADRQRRAVGADAARGGARARPRLRDGRLVARRRLPHQAAGLPGAAPARVGLRGRGDGVGARAQLSRRRGRR